MSGKKRKAFASNDSGRCAASFADVLIPPEFYSSSSKAWDTQAELLTPSKARKKLLTGLYDTSQFRKILKTCEQHEPLEFGRDLNAARFKDGVRATPNAQVADSKTVWGLYQQGCTLQVHQPQRFHEPLATICSGLEQRLGCLVGVNAYLTPPSTQGLAPHHDDVEIFVCQTQGSKRWRLYDFKNGFAKPSQPSGDLPEDSLGKPTMDVTLKVGDVLYMPRGTIHQAVAQEEASTHLTISTYQNWTYGTLAQAVLHAGMQGQQEPVCLPLSLRDSLPPGFLFSHGFQADTAKELEAAVPQEGTDPASCTLPCLKLAAALRDLADRLEQQPQLMSRAADLMSQDFMDSRAPVPEESLLPAGPEPTMEHSVVCCAKNAFRMVEFEAAEAAMTGPMIKIISCLSNLIKDHMMGGEDEAMLNPADDCCGPSSDCCQPSGDLCHDSGCDHTANGHTGLPAQHQLSGSDEEKGAGKSEEEDGDDSDQADLVLPAAYSLAVAQLLSAHSCAVNVKDIKLDGDEMKLDLAATMWKEGILSARPEVSKSEPCKKLKK